MADEEVTSEGSPMEEDELELSLGPPNLRRNPAKSTLFMTVSGNLNLNLNLDLRGQIFDSVIQKRETQAMRRREARRKREEKRRAKNGGLSSLNDVVFERKAMESRSVDRERREKESDGDFAFQWRKTVTVDKEVSKTTSYQNGSYGSQNDVVFERKAMESRCVDRERREKESDGDFAFRWRKKVTVNDEVSKTMSYGNVGVFLMPCLVESESNIVNVLKEVVPVTAADGGGFNNCTSAPVAVKNCSGGETSGSGGSSCEVPDYQSTSGHGGSISSEAGSHSRHSSPSLRSPLKPGLASTSPESQPCQSPPQPQAQPQPGSSIGTCPSPVKVDCEVDHMQNQNTTSTNLTHFQQSPETQIVSSDKNRNLTRTSSNQTHFQQPLRSQPVSPDRNPMLTLTASNPTHFRKSMGSQIASPNGNPNPNQMPSNQTHFQQPLKTQLVNLDKNPTMSQALSTLTHFQPQKARLASLDKNLNMMQTPSNQTHFEAPLKTQFTSLDKNTTLTKTASNPTHFQLQKTQVMSPDRNPRVDHMPSNLTQIQLPKTRSPSVEKSPTPDSRSPSGPLSHPENGDHKPPRVPSTSRAEKHILAQMPCVSATGNGPNGKTITGFLYRYTKSDVSIVCVCHGTSFSPAGFVEHAGGIDIEHPLRHIRVIPFPLS